MKTLKLMAWGALAAATGAYAQLPTKTITTASLNNAGGAGYDTTYFDRDTVYFLSGRVFVGQDAAHKQAIVIEPGTVFKGKPGDGALASALIVSKWGRIYANGTASDPIVFTAQVDDVNDPNDLGAFDRGLWGGVILLGNAPISEGTAFIEGIDAEPRAEFGGSVSNDTSGSMTYVSIRHGGKLLGGANEINGLTFGGVGSGTNIHHIEVFANNDDGFEWFGGTVNAKYLVSAYGNDDAFDFDFGYRGKLQYGFAAYHHGNNDPNGNQGIEGDGFSFPLSGTTNVALYSKPRWSNITLLGNGNPQTLSSANDLAFRLRDGTGGDFKNMIIQNWPVNAGRIEQQGSLACDAPCNMLRDSLNIDGSVFFNIGNWLGDFSDILVNGVGGPQLAASNVYANPQLASVGWSYNSLDPRPSITGPAVTTTHYQMGDPFFDNVFHAGAFGVEDWMHGWTAIYKMGISKRGLLVQAGAMHDRGTLASPARLYRGSRFDITLLQMKDLVNSINVPASTITITNHDQVGSPTFDLKPLFADVLNGPGILTSQGRLYKAFNNQAGSVFGPAGRYTMKFRLVLNGGGTVVQDSFTWQTYD